MTELGQAMARLPVSPRLGRMLLEGQRLGQPEAVALAAALLSERDPFPRTRRRGCAAAAGPAVVRLRRARPRGGAGGVRAVGPARHAAGADQPLGGAVRAARARSTAPRDCVQALRAASARSPGETEPHGRGRAPGPAGGVSRSPGPADQPGQPVRADGRRPGRAAGGVQRGPRGAAVPGRGRRPRARRRPWSGRPRRSSATGCRPSIFRSAPRSSSTRRPAG